MMATLTTIGAATLAAILVGVGAWLISELIIESSRPEAIRYGASAAVIVLLVGAVIAVVRALRSSR